MNIDPPKIYRARSRMGVLILGAFWLLFSTASTVRAQTWLPTPTSGDWNAAANWDTANIPNGSSAVATFGASAVTNISNTFASVTLGGIQFDSGASAYKLYNNSGQFTFQGAGVVDSSGMTQQLSNYGILLFQNTSSAGDLLVTGSGSATFTDSSTAGDAVINNRSTLQFDTNATAGNSTINTTNGQVFFIGNSSAGQANLVNSGTVSFGDSASAGSATITTNGVGVIFSGNTTADNASITNVSGLLQFDTNATAGNAFILNENSLDFLGSATAGSATILNRSYAQFNSGADAGSAMITNDDHLLFNAGSSAVSARITNDGTLVFYDQSSAGNAQVTTGNNGNTVFLDSADGGSAELTTLSGGALDVSGVTTGIFTLGSYAQESGGTLQVAVGSTAQDAITVGGNAALGGSLSLVFKTFSLTQGDSVTILTAGGNVSGRFDQWTNPQNGRLFPFYGSNLVYLESVLPTFQVAGLTSNEKAVAQGLDGAFENPDRYSLMADLVSRPATDLPAAYGQMDPSGLTSLYRMGFQMSSSRMGMAARRLEQESAASSSAKVLSGKGGEVLFAADMPAEEERALARGSAVGPSWRVFFNGYGGFGTLDGDGNAAGYRISSGGLVAGMDRELGADWTGGLFLGYGQGTANLEAGGKADLSGGQVGLYAGWRNRGFHLEAVAEAGLNNYQVQQASYEGTVSGKAAGQEYAGRLGAGYDLRLEELRVEPFAWGEYDYVHMDGFNESGSVAPLEFPGQGEGTLASDLGVKVRQPWKWNDVTLGPALTAAWQHVYQGNQDSIASGFGGSTGSFTVQGPGTGRDGLVLGLSLDADFNGAWKAYVSYQGRIGMTNYAEQNLDGGIKFDF